MCCIFEYEWFIVAYACIFCVFWHAKINLGLKGLIKCGMQSNHVQFDGKHMHATLMQYTTTLM